MRKVILHIGRHKTGTTSIQRFLSRNRSMLLKHGFVYPEYGIRGFGHHELGAPLTRSSLARSDMTTESTLELLRAKLEKELSAEADGSVSIISSESFQNCDPQVVRSYFREFEVEVVVYIREQVQYLVSAYAQKIQSSDYCGSLEDFFDLTSNSTYKEFLEKWESAFSAQLMVKNYDRDALMQGDVVIDFCETVLGIGGDIVQQYHCQTDANPTLTRDLLNFKIWVNKNLVLSPEDSRVLFNAMSRLAMEDESGSLQIAPGLAEKVVQRYEQSNRYVAKNTLREERFLNRLNPSWLAALHAGRRPS